MGKERPILFSPTMVRALLDGRKRQTRRIVNSQPPSSFYRHAWYDKPIYGWTPEQPPAGTWHTVRCPYGQDGDLLYVRELWQYWDWTEDGEPWIRYAVDQSTKLCRDIPEDWVDRVNDVWAYLSERSNTRIDGCARDRRWRPSIVMPRWASRIKLEITDVRVERVQEITEADAIAEGVDNDCWVNGQPMSAVWFNYLTNGWDGALEGARDSYRTLWDSIHAKPKPVYWGKQINHYVSYPWEDTRETRQYRGKSWHVTGNPYAWVLTFKQVT